jgi:hypothetical protein
MTALGFSGGPMPTASSPVRSRPSRTSPAQSPHHLLALGGRVGLLFAFGILLWVAAGCRPRPSPPRG